MTGLRDLRAPLAGALLVLIAGAVASVALVAVRDRAVFGYVSWSAAGVAVLLVPGLAAVVVALESLRRRGSDRAAVLLALAGIASLLPEVGLAGVRSSLAFTSGLVLAWSALPFAAHVAFAARRRRPGRVLVASGYVCTIGALGLLPALAFDPVAQGCGACARNLVLVHGSNQLETMLGRAGVVVSLAWALGAIATILIRLAGATNANRLVAAPLQLATVILLGSFAAELVLSARRGYLVADGPGRMLWRIGQLALLAMALAVAAGWLRARRARVLLARDVVELASSSSKDTVAARLARALHDDTLEVGYPIGADAQLVDASGMALARETRLARTTTTLGHRGGEPLAVLRHRDGLLDDPALVREIAQAAGLALANERLRAETRARLAELRASRVRIVEAADAERRRLERDLHDGAQQRLVSLAVALRAARSPHGGSPVLDEAQDELARALDELRAIARGIHPAVLSDAGLTAAVVALGETSRVPIAVGPMPLGRFEPLAETTAYFVVAEAAADPAAGRLAVEADARDGTLSLRVLTDSPTEELTRYSDRVGAIGGTIRRVPIGDNRVELEVSIPCGS